MTIPKIESEGDPPERHAKRIVSEMLQWLVPRHDEMIQQAAASFNRPNGNPVAQRRSMARLKTNEAILATRLQAGKRGNYYVCWHDWGLWDTVLDREATVFRPHTDLLWLVVWRNEFWFERGKLIEAVHVPRLFVTYHALVRLAERGGARTWQDLIGALREIWNVYFAHVGKECDALKAPPLRRIALSGGGLLCSNPMSRHFLAPSRDRAHWSSRQC